MSLWRVILEPWSSYLASRFVTFTLRIVIIMHCVNLILSEVRTEMPHQGQTPLTGPMATASSRARCKCHSRSPKSRGSQSHTQDLALLHENADREGLHYYMRLSAYLSHPSHQNNSRHPGSKARRKHGHQGDIPWDDTQSILILEQTWSDRWGKCQTEICDVQTCRRVTINVACVGPCQFYRKYKCPHKFGRFCVTSPDYDGCRKHRKEHAQDNRFQKSEGNREHNLSRDDDDQEDGDNDDDNTDVEVSDADRDDDDKNDDNEDKIQYRQKNGSGEEVNTYHNSRVHSLSTVTVAYDVPTSKQDRSVSLAVIPSFSEEGMHDKGPEPKEQSHANQRRQEVSDAAASGIRYVWVVSCIIVPTLVFCIGYAVAMHVRRKRFLRQCQRQPRPPGQALSASEPFLPVSAPPYSAEDIYTCPRVGIHALNVNIPPPSYEVACSASEIAASRERTRTLSACSAFLQPAPLSSSVPAMAPPPYDENNTEETTTTHTRGHTRLPSYDSAICLHTSI